MKGITLAAVAAFAGLTISAGASAGAPMATTRSFQQSCPAAPAVARAYLAEQAGKKLTMSRAAVIAEITKLTGLTTSSRASSRATLAIRTPSDFTSTK